MSSIKNIPKKKLVPISKQNRYITIFDKYRGQLDTPGIFTFPRPAIFMSFGRFEWESGINGTQRGTGVIKFRIAVENYADSFEGSFNQDLALEFFEFNEKVHEALQGLSVLILNL